ncbi:MAG: RNA polymerase subunit sigma, partial [Deltaproteobacteria bacterium]|nr:RNA polymerase subunit sigma [Deltaproteobacteria bacterium]
IPLHGEFSRPDQVLEGKRLEAAISREIAALEDDHRVLIVLRDIQGLTYDEIVTITSLPVGTVKSRLHRARMALKDRLEKFL